MSTLDHDFRPGRDSHVRERRLLCFGRFDKSADRAEKTKEARNTVESERNERVKAAEKVYDRLNGPFDPARHQDLQDAKREAYLMGDMPESRRYEGVYNKAERLQQIYGSRASIEGIKFGLEGGKFTIISADEVFIGWALSYITAQVSEFQRPDDAAELRLPQRPGESDANYARRIAAVERDGTEAKRLGQNRKKEDIVQWERGWPRKC